MRRYNRLLVGLSSLIWILFAVDAPFACTCFTRPVLESFDRAPLVFRGVVLDGRGPRPHSNGLSYGSDPSSFRFHVLEVWKGEAPDTLRVCTASSGASCGYSFELGGEYLVYVADREAAALNDCEAWTSLCSRTQQVSRARGECLLLDRIPDLPIGLADEKRARRLVDAMVGLLGGEAAPTRDIVDALRLLAPASRFTVDRVASLWDESDRETRSSILGALSSFESDKPSVIHVCEDASRQGDSTLRERGIRTLLRVAPESRRARDAVYAALSDTAASVHRAIVGSLAAPNGLSAEQSAHVVRRALREGSRAQRMAAIDAIVAGDWSERLSWVDLEPMCFQDSVIWRAGAYAALGHVSIDSSAGDRLLRSALHDPDFRVREIATASAAQIARRGVPLNAIIELALADTTESVAMAAARAIDSLERDPLEACRLATIAFADSRPGVRRCGVESAPYAEPHCWPLLLAATRDPDPEVRLSALRPLFRIDALRDSVEAFALRVLADADSTVVSRALRRLPFCARDLGFALETLDRLAESSSPQIRSTASRIAHQSRTDSRQTHGLIRPGRVAGSARPSHDD